MGEGSPSDPQDETHDDLLAEQQHASPENSKKLNRVMASVTELSLCDQISRCFEFFIGILSVNELHLQSLLLEFYSDTSVSSRGQCQATALDFRSVHGVTSVVAVAKLFPGTAHH